MFYIMPQSSRCSGWLRALSELGTAAALFQNLQGQLVATQHSGSTDDDDKPIMKTFCTT
jgi:hypothetical protein